MEKGVGFTVTMDNGQGNPRTKSYANEEFATAAAERFIKNQTVKEDGAPAAPAPAATSGAPATTTSNMGATYAPKVMPMTSHYGEFGLDKYDQHFMKKMRKKLNEGADDNEPQEEDITIQDETRGGYSVGGCWGETYWAC